MSELAVGSLAGLAANSYVIDVASGSQLTQPGMVLQVVSATYSTQTVITSTSYADTGLSLSITPTSTTSKILVLTNQFVSLDDRTLDTCEYFGVIVRDATEVYEIKNRDRTRGSTDAEQSAVPFTMTYLDSPSTTSSVTYKTQAKHDANTNTLVFQLDNSSSSITLMEIAG